LEERILLDESSNKSYVLNAGSGSYVILGAEASCVVVTYPQKLLALAQELINREEHSVSIVVTHIACEVAVDRAFAQAFKAKGIESLEDAVEELLPSNNLGNDRVRQLYTALTGDAIQNQPFWSRFKESAGRRNKVSHNGKIYDKPEAEASLAVAKEFVAHLKQ
jgi:hypothetical protein